MGADSCVFRQASCTRQVLRSKTLMLDHTMNAEEAVQAMEVCAGGCCQTSCCFLCLGTKVAGLQLGCWPSCHGPCAAQALGHDFYLFRDSKTNAVQVRPHNVLGSCLLAHAFCWCLD